MIFRTHYAFGFLVSVLFMQFVSVPYPFLFVGLVTLLSSLPDIDTKNSRIGRKVWFLSIPISLVFKHRGFFHSVFPALILFFVLRSFGWDFLALVIVVAYMGHLLGDAMTVEGVNFLHPVSTFRIQGFMRTGSSFEAVVFVILFIMDVVLIMKKVGL